MKQQDEDLLSLLIEIQRLLKRTRVSLHDALGLVVDQLRWLEREEQQRGHLLHADYPAHVYGYISHDDDTDPGHAPRT